MIKNSNLDEVAAPVFDLYIPLEKHLSFPEICVVIYYVVP